VFDAFNFLRFFVKLTSLFIMDHRFFIKLD
ncbi:MAG: hypothetical protein ACI9O3_001144, partial [Colwellia sp.]